MERERDELVELVSGALGALWRVRLELSLLALPIVVYLVVGGVFKYLDIREARQPQPEYPLAAAEENRLPPEPRLQTNPRQDLADLRAREEQALTSYSWVDRNAGVVRIPIDEAIKKTLERGLPARIEQSK